MTDSACRPGSAVDPSAPQISRVYDVLLGGSHNFAADRELARQMVAAMPGLPAVARANRVFVHRAVGYLLGCGVRQFLDLGCGLPTAGAVHEVAHRVDPAARVVYVDLDPVVAAFAGDHLGQVPQVAAVCADLRQPWAVLGHADTLRLIDFSRPVGLLMVAVLHFVPDVDDPAALVGAYRAVLAPGSRLVVSHATAEATTTSQGLAAAVALTGQTPTRLTPRSREQVAALLDGFDPEPPGLVRLPCWRPEPGDGQLTDAATFPGWAAVARQR